MHLSSAASSSAARLDKPMSERAARERTTRDASATRSSRPGPRLRLVESALRSPPLERRSGPLADGDEATRRAAFVDSLRFALAETLCGVTAALTRLAAVEPILATGESVVRTAPDADSSALSVLLSIDARRHVLTRRAADGSVASWLVAGGRIVARLPPESATRLGDGVTVTANGVDFALLVVRKRGPSHGESSVTLRHDLATLDVLSRARPAWLGRLLPMSPDRQRRHDLRNARPSNGGDRGHRCLAPGGSDERVAVPGMSARDAEALSDTWLGLKRLRAGDAAIDRFGPRALDDPRAFRVAASEHFLSGEAGANVVLDVSPVLYGVLVRYHGVSFATRAAPMPS